MSPCARRPSAIAAVVAVVAAMLTLLVAVAPTAEAARGRSHAATPGSLTGFAFDTCAAPAQPVMDAWRESSPYAGIGIYLGGSNRQCDQPELTSTWVRTQLAHGWHLLPLWVGPQASCSGYADVMSPDLATAVQQGRVQAAAAISTAQSLGIARSSTLYYDLEDYDLAPDDCRRAALSFLSGWTDTLHAAGYDSGVYSNIAAAITSLDFADRVSPGSYSMPDDIWFAWANGRSDSATDTRVQSARWDDHARVHQYSVGVTQSYGGYPLVVDSNWVDVGQGSTARTATPLCRGVDVDLRRYPSLRPGGHGPAVAALQCLLRHQHVYRGALDGHFDARTAGAVRTLERRLHLRADGRVTRPTWTALLARGGQPLLKVGSTGTPVLRLQRSLTAALGRTVVIDGVFSKKTAQAVLRFQRRHHLERTGVVGDQVWDALLGR